MEEKELEKERALVIKFNLTRGLVAVLVAALLAVAFVGYLALGQRKASASPATAPKISAAALSGVRKYYMTRENHLGASADTACTAGYHMASLWEILDISNLEYDVGLGEANDDSGQGPAAGYLGWVRTGHGNSITGSAGQGNCDGWGSSSSDAYGTAVGLTMDWTQAPDIGAAWAVSTETCDTGGISVWCVEDE